MGYTADRPLTELFPGGDFADEAGRRITRRVLEHMEDGVRRRTPVAEMPVAYLAVRGAGGEKGWIKDRKGRLPGTLRASWFIVDPVLAEGGVWRGSVETEDPVANLVEDDTRPHLIRPRKPGGTLRFPKGVAFLYRKSVRHPGTEGVHMMRDTLAETEARWPELAEAELEELAAEAEVGAPRRI